MSHEEKTFSVEQIVVVLKQAELGLPVADLIPRLWKSMETMCTDVHKRRLFWLRSAPMPLWQPLMPLKPHK
jgi:hypothetical protein